LWTAQATHLGEFQGIPPSGQPGIVSGISIFRLANGSIVECWTNYDALGLLQQLGVF
jgi:predicted ester cyclase